MRDLSELNLNAGGRPVDRLPPSDDEVKAFEARFGVRLPAAYVSFLRFSNGGHPELSAYQPIGAEEEYLRDINRFYFLDDDKTNIEGLWRATEEWQKALDQRVVPIAFDGGGNQVLLDFQSDPPAVKLCIHDEDFHMIAVAKSFEEFIDLLCDDPDLI